MFKHKIFNFFKSSTIEGIILRGIIFGYGSVSKWIDYSDTNNGVDLMGGIAFGAMALFAIDDYLIYKKEKNKIINE